MACLCLTVPVRVCERVDGGSAGMQYCSEGPMRRGTQTMWGPVAHGVAIGPLILQLYIPLYNSARARSGALGGPPGQRGAVK